MKQPTLENQKTFINLFLIYLGVLVSLFITNFFFFGGGSGGRGGGSGGGGGGAPFATFLSTIKMITVHAAICTLLRYDC